MASSLQDWEKRSDNLHKWCDSRTEERRGMKEWTNMARLNLWCDSADDRKQLVVPTASIQIWSVQPLSTCPFILPLSLHLWFIPSSRHESLLILPTFTSRGTKKKKVPLQSTGGQQSCLREVLPTRSLWAPSGPPAVSVGTSRTGEPRPPAARPPPCPGTAGSYAALGWWRRPTEKNKRKKPRSIRCGMEGAGWRRSGGRGRFYHHFSGLLLSQDEAERVAVGPRQQAEEQRLLAVRQLAHVYWGRTEH